MSLVYQMNSGGSSKVSGSAQASSSAQTKGSVDTNGDKFNQTLAQSLSGAGVTGESNEAEGTLTNQTANLLRFTFSSESEQSDASLGDVLSSLFAETDKTDLSDKLEKLFGEMDGLDEALENDPVLLANLQTLIQQIYTLLNKKSDSDTSIHLNEGSATDSMKVANSLPVAELSQHPATIRFVLQDALTQIAAKVQKLNMAVMELAPEFKQLLGELQGQLKKAGIETDSKKGWSELKSVLDSFSVMKEQAVQTAGATSVTAHEGETEIQPPTIITAGELSLRSSGTTVGKPAEPVMQASLFAKEMTQFVVNKLDIVQQKGFSEATISLRPEHLGKLDVQITLQNGQLVARFVTEHVMAKDMLEQQMMQLRSSLQAQGIQVERLEVTQNSALGSEMYQNGGRQQGSQSQQEQRSNERGEHTDEAMTAAELQEELRNWRSEQVEGIEVRRDSFSAEA
ncbi:hypothetical protein PAECIP112173_00660 [Paenibacillus sp. JJ-100]|uniref:flagellar hook-length control protein FliK n=1 Tax=Paenibacillus sp. JJ-100 TaxID=2974896 RepID=UPI0022FF8B33|nr:flagellar hook-length control protein FliK [Paenibacillus sp. JJ-100]CAI6031666.1 hypothetical protein PAECIP112173_00660 [Paenibacillus sp. JJ-100]